MEGKNLVVQEIQPLNANEPIDGEPLNKKIVEKD
ncbi:hypothetical protein COLO4_25196 [Corchorus olitorius]|uniref:Uncharacterized protein n=1 Tax=Corchorus olitorius TaxID=93759 RepID=A0A1R3I4A7_9ROSI|nr:hypothetical protein COLO4_25196 [Corchorus olitorius]